MRTVFMLIAMTAALMSAGCSAMSFLTEDMAFLTNTMDGLRPTPDTETVVAEAPIMMPEPNLGGDDTLLDHYLRVYRDYVREKSRAEDLAIKLENEKSLRVAAEEQARKLAAETAELRVKADRLEVVANKYDEAQAKLLEYEDQMRELRRQLLEEKVARVRSEQTLVAMKIERIRSEQQKNEAPAAPNGDNTIGEIPREEQ